MCIRLLLQVVIDAFRLINPNMMVLGQESRQTTSNLGHLQKPSIQVYILTLSDRYVNSPYISNALSSRQVMRMK